MLRIKIVTTGSSEFDVTDPDSERFLREAMAGDKWQVADVTDAWRSDVSTDDHVTITEDGKVIWEEDL